jgi:replication fork protection complex subunit Tof1/Swi1
MERAKVREADNIRYLFLVCFFLEYFLALREYETSSGVDPASEDGHDFDLISEMSDPATIGYVALRMKLCLEDEVSGRDHVFLYSLNQSTHISLNQIGPSCTQL